MTDESYKVVSTADEAEHGIYAHEVRTNTNFTNYRRNKEFSSTDTIDYKAHQIWWEDGKADDRCKIDTNGCPYIILGYDVRECQHGPDRNIKKKIQYKAEKEEKSKTDHSYVMKGRTLIQNTKKMICPARITQRRIIKFPGYRLENSSSKWRRKQTAKTLRKALEESSADVVKEEEIHMYYPTADDHKNHIIGEFAGLCQPVGPEVKAKIRQLVGDGVIKVSEMKRHLKVFVKKELEIEDQTIPSRRFYPTDKDIRNHMDTTKNKFRFSKDDQTNLEHLVQGWTKTFPDDNFYLRTCLQNNKIYDNKDMCYKEIGEGEKTKYECKICGTLLSTKQRIFTHLINKHNKSPMKRVYKVYEDDPSLPIPKRTVLRHQSRRNILHNEELLTLSSSDEDMFVNSQENEGIVHVPYSEKSDDLHISGSDDGNKSCSSKSYKSDSEIFETSSYYSSDCKSEFTVSDSEISTTDTEEKTDMTDFSDIEFEASCPNQNEFTETETQAMCIMSYILRHNLTGVAANDLLKLLPVLLPSFNNYEKLTYGKILSTCGETTCKVVDYCSSCERMFPIDPDIYLCQTENCNTHRYKGSLSAQRNSSRQPKCSFVIADIQKQLQYILGKKGVWQSVQSTKTKIKKPSTVVFFYGLVVFSLTQRLHGSGSVHYETFFTHTCFVGDIFTCFIFFPQSLYCNSNKTDCIHQSMY